MRFIIAIITGLTVSSTCPSLLIRSLSHHPVDAVTRSRLLGYFSTSHLVLRLLSIVEIPLAISTVVSPSLATWVFRRMLSKALRVILSFIVDLIGNVGLEPLYYYPTVVCKPLHFIPSNPYGSLFPIDKGLPDFH